MPHYKVLIEQVKALRGVKELKDVYAGIIAIVNANQYYFYDTDAENKKARAELKAELEALYKEKKPAEFMLKAWKMSKEPEDAFIYNAATSKPQEIFDNLYGTTGGTLLIGSMKYYDDMYAKNKADEKAKKDAEISKQMAKYGPLYPPHLLDRASTGAEEEKKFDAVVDPLHKEFAGLNKTFQDLVQAAQQGKPWDAKKLEAHEAKVADYEKKRKAAAVKFKDICL